MNNSPHIEVRPGFERMELPSLFCWMQNQWSFVADDDVPAQRDEWITYQLEKLSFDFPELETPEFLTFGVYLNRGIAGWGIAGYVEAAVSEPLSYSPDGFLSGVLPETVAVVQAIFQKQMWGLQNTVPAMRMVLSHIFRTDVEQVIFPVYSYNEPMKKLYEAIGARNVGLVASVTGTMSMERGEPLQVETFILPRAEWRKNNAAFIASYEPQEVAVGAEV